ncbi:(R)-mandelonitrile lyase-like [Thalictrum thalictroides]|uniref:(R)-mandelonitrile lyase-like n=1 Tax=Thalictrum thalictroides TaxID=46969 RepID=A0A7J6VQF6_THATH|nr:(R)-mandelonitrile lyase-like [Thalictrum thalictroides]
MRIIKKKPTLLFLLLCFTFINSLVLAQQQPQGPSYLQFVFNATEFSPEEEYDYIIVGGGTAGCPLAATLSENHKVLVLERGGHTLEYPNLWSQEGFLATLTQINTYDSPAEPFTSEDGVSNARGRVLGGSSAINAGFYSRADPDFFYKSGFTWNLDLVNRSYDWVENVVVFRPQLRNWQSSIRNGLLEANITPYNGYNLNHVVGTKIGGSTFDGLGRRHTAADLLNHARPSNVRVALHASVERILFNTLSSTSSSGGGGVSSSSKKPEAIGVVYRDRIGRHHHAMVRGEGEVIVCAGALGSPQLLLLSGIGPRAYLSSWGIPVVHHLPNVGQYLYDNPRNGISIVPPLPLEHSLIQVVGITETGTYIEAASNIIPFTSPPRNIFLHNPGSSSLYLTVATIMEKISGPLSFGSLRLASTDVRVNPLVRFNYFSNTEDLARCVSGMRKIGEVLRGRSLEEFKFPEWFGGRDFRYVGPMLPFNQSDDGLMGEFCRRTVTTIWHYHGGCVVGKVVDGDHRVIGVDKLRIIDGSTLSMSPGTNPQATLMMLGRYMGRRMVEERRRGQMTYDPALLECSKLNKTWKM